MRKTILQYLVVSFVFSAPVWSAIDREIDGVGIAIQKTKSGRFLVSDIIAGSSAEGDKDLTRGVFIQAINNGEGWQELEHAQSIRDVVQRIRGPVGTKVRLHVTDASGDWQRVVEVIRYRFRVPSAQVGE